MRARRQWARWPERRWHVGAKLVRHNARAGGRDHLDFIRSRVKCNAQRQSLRQKPVSRSSETMPSGKLASAPGALIDGLQAVHVEAPAGQRRRGGHQAASSGLIALLSSQLNGARGCGETRKKTEEGRRSCGKKISPLTGRRIHMHLWSHLSAERPGRHAKFPDGMVSLPPRHRVYV